ncbi:hypothetical protein Ciccas_000586 [Cichlidogyrus casuarinus]|uniref:6-pyruvoyltetrahydropterin synthase n=1 Tax=Cichlidogyrus casuarinus TaxID=1844966 RepID=A0ABD2QMG6_9PLAT
MSPEENVKIFSKCNNVNGHGHNYKFEVTLFGEIDPITGMVMNLSTLKEIIQNEVMAHLDHKNIDKDVAFFSQTGTVSTTENVCVFIWNQLQAKLPNDLLYEVKVHETDKNTFTFRGDF